MVRTLVFNILISLSQYAISTCFDLACNVSTHYNTASQSEHIPYAAEHQDVTQAD
jgi:hypothetical protein